MSIEDFTTYTEVDPNAKLTVTSSKADGVNVDKDEDVYLYDDKGVDRYNKIDIDFEVYISSASLGGALAGMGMSITAVSTVQNFGATDISVLQRETGAGAHRIALRRGNNVANDEFTTGAADTLYYCTLARAKGSDTVTVKIYSDSNRTTLLDTLSVSGFGTGTRYRYLYGFVNRNEPQSGDDFDGYVQNMEDFSHQYIVTSLSGKIYWFN